MMPDYASRIAENVARVRERMAVAAGRSGRAADAVTLVAVTKYVSAEAVRPLVEAGCHDLGESRPQQLWDKAARLADLPVRWHMIGHLQRNKVRRTLPLVSMVHSVDSLRLLAALDEELHAAQGVGWDKRSAVPPMAAGTMVGPRSACPTLLTPVPPLPVLLEVNVSGEAAKHGLTPEEVEPLLAELPDYRRVAVRGLMCMAGVEGDLDAARRDFAALRQLRDRLRPRFPPEVTLDELSMGMSGDFEVAIEEGATIVRIGSALFDGVQ